LFFFQHDALIVRSVSFAQKIFQKIKRFQANDSSDVKPIIAYLLEKRKIEQGTPGSVLQYLKDNLGDPVPRVVSFPDQTGQL